MREARLPIRVYAYKICGKLDIRIFDEITKKAVYKLQTAKAKEKAKSNGLSCCCEYDNNSRKLEQRRRN